MNGAELISAERATHEGKGYTSKHDDRHVNEEIAQAATCLVGHLQDEWGLQLKAMKEGGRIRVLTVAGALIAAEIDRLIRKVAYMEAIRPAIQEGYGGVLPNGNVVDRRIYPDAIPIPANTLFGTPEPKQV